MKNKKRSYLIILAWIAFFLLLIVSSSTALAVNDGYTLASQGNYEEAIKAFDKVIGIYSQSSDPWYNKGICLAHLGNYEEAVEALDKAIDIDPQNLEALILKESIISNSNELTILSKIIFSNNDMFAEEDDLLEYAQTYLKTYEDIIDKSNLTREDLELFSFYQGYPYSVKINISNVNGASITFIPHSVDEDKVTRVSYPIESLFPQIDKEKVNKSGIMFLIDDNFSNSSFLRY